ncbi:LLM class flavin-dependent oxidoreductase [Arenibacter sp. GZD96]|uniref:LLM class flavin-dependent oxidoreductase n=1 Tax=Aurantibrevibacter litoralis TaxID=3106030 RepID=UPI002AFE2097|nr:LLM class flavin-dependent oxidoreductase [Arenibacter sp. GZD-96]MEA1784840.1 LLM class flavin-dependent oxidoreductase [Arenibacter sp. GZD-96]
MKQWNPVAIRTEERVAEMAWYTDVIGGDTDYLGVLDPTRRSNFEHCKKITLAAEELGFRNVLFPTAYTVGQEVIPFAAAIAPFTSRINLLTAIRTGEVHPPTLARTLANLDHLLHGRLTINIINSDLPGLRENPEMRYQRCSEIIEILKQGWTRDRIQYQGKYYAFDLPADPVKPYQQNGGPLLYFGGISEGSKEVCATHCDVFLMWPETEERMYTTMKDMSERAAKKGRKIDFGLRIHVFVRETESEARAYIKQIMSKFNEARALEIRSRGEDSRSLGVHRQDQLRKTADKDGFIEDILWTSIGKVFSGCGGGLVGSAAQVVEKLNRYMDMGFRSFIFSGFPLQEEARNFSNLVLPHVPNATLSKLQNRTPINSPVTPLTTGILS